MLFTSLDPACILCTNPNPTAGVQNSISDPRPSIPGPSNYSKHSKHKQQQQQHSSTSSGSNAATSNRPSNAALKLFEQSKGVQDGREMASEVFNVDVDTLFTLLFTNSKFYADFNAMRKTFGETMRGKKLARGNYVTGSAGKVLNVIECCFLFSYLPSAMDPFLLYRNVLGGN